MLAGHGAESAASRLDSEVAGFCAALAAAHLRMPRPPINQALPNEAGGRCVAEDFFVVVWHCGGVSRPRRMRWSAGLDLPPLEQQLCLQTVYSEQVANRYDRLVIYNDVTWVCIVPQLSCDSSGKHPHLPPV